MQSRGKAWKAGAAGSCSGLAAQLWTVAGAELPRRSSGLRDVRSVVGSA